MRSRKKGQGQGARAILILGGVVDVGKKVTLTTLLIATPSFFFLSGHLALFTPLLHSNSYHAQRNQRGDRPSYHHNNYLASHPHNHSSSEGSQGRENRKLGFSLHYQWVSCIHHEALVEV